MNRRTSWFVEAMRGALAHAVLVCGSTFAVGGEPSHGFAYFGDLKYPKDMARFDYANRDAPKGGVIRMPGIGSFNNLNPYVDKGILPYYMDPRLGSAIYDPLMKASEDELASYYGVLAESVEVADDYGWVTYTLREDAYWHDGQPVTVDDVLWTFDMLKTEASISWRSAYREIVALERVGPRSFKFVFAEDAEKTPHLIVQTTGFTTLPKHYWENRDFGATTLE
ncbi:MAG: ABC transporter substrate-binding protein, partial [Gammaproteobacteria bacterium]|nr:ABC transporter substrate-binding protein [Gammaproteobacteria bacterium]